MNCAALPDDLIENELFGHSKGAFTGAFAEKHGLFHEADGGTLFLDEINSLSLTVQSKLLRVLQDQEFRPLGSTKSRQVDVKVLVASNMDLRHLVEMRQFREDLFHRLNVLSVVLPPLRDRREDILLLATHFLKVYAKEFGRGAITLGHSSKGETVGIPLAGQCAGTGRCDAACRRHGGAEAPNPMILICPLAKRLISWHRPRRWHPGWTPLTKAVFKDENESIEEFERTYLCNLLSTHQGNISKAARAAKKERRAFQRLLHTWVGSPVFAAA